MSVFDREGKRKYLGKLLRIEEDEHKTFAFFEFDLGFQKWHTQEVEIEWTSLRDLVPGQLYTVFTSMKTEMDQNYNKIRAYKATVWMRED